MNPLLLNVIIQNLPAGIALFQTLFHKAHPDELVPTDAEVVAAFDAAYQSSVAKDDRWLAAHGEQ